MLEPFALSPSTRAALAIVCSNGLALASQTGHGTYREEALSTAEAVDRRLADDRGVFANLQAENDAVAPRKFAGVLKAALGDRVTVVVIPNAGHALVPEQPEAMANAIAAFARTLQ